METIKKLTTVVLFILCLAYISAQEEFVSSTDNYVQNAIEKAIIDLSQLPSQPEMSEMNVHSEYLRAPNSYIYDLELAENQNYSGIKIPVKKAFAAWASTDWYLNQPLNETHQLSTFIYWEDVPGLVQETSIEEAPEKADSKIIVKINPKKGKGNALISLHLGTNGNHFDPIVWSWHIWVTDDPTQGVSFGQGLETDLNGNGFTPQYMDRNLGAVYHEILGDNWHKNIGLMYQWGRKDPIPTMVTKDFSFYELNGLVGYMRNREGIHEGNILPEVQRPFTDISSNLKFVTKNPIAYLLNSDSGTWFSTQQYRVMNSNEANIVAWDLWSDNMKGGNSNANSSNTQIRADSRSYELKSPYDPCPSGWRIPSYLGRATTNNNLGPWGRQNSAGNDDTNYSRRSFLPDSRNPSIIGAKVHSGLGIDFTNTYDNNTTVAGSRDIGIMPTTGYYVRYISNGQATVVFQDENAIGALWSATYSIGGARYLRIVTDPLRPDVSEYGLNEIMVNQTTFSMEALPVRCMRDPNLSLIGDFETEYIHSSKTYFTEGLENPNSYIVNNSEMLIPVNKAFSAYEYLFPEEEGLAYDDLIANVYWTDNPDLVQTVKIIGEGDPRQKFIRVQLNVNERGNAVISLHNGSIDNPVYWSWHLWSVANSINEITYVNGNILPATYNFVNITGSENPVLTTVFMDRNLGAIYNLPTEIRDYPSLPELQNEVKNSGGLHYQWGRKDPIPSFRYVGGENYEIYRGSAVDTNGVVSYTAINQLTYMSQFTETYSNYKDGFNPNNSDDKYERADKVIQYSVQNPLTYLHHSTTDTKDWVSSELALKHERWGHAQKKSIYDPCPQDWRVPDTFKVYENGRGSSPWFNGKKLASLQGNPQFINSHYGGQFFHHDGKSVGWFFDDADYAIGHFPTTGIIGKFSPNEIGGTSIQQAITGIWTSALNQQLKGDALAMQIGILSGSDHKMIATGKISPAYGLNVRCAKEAPRYDGTMGEDYFVLSTRDFSHAVKEEFKIFPNPVNDYLNISSSLDLRIEIYNLQGQLVQKGKFENKKINLSTLPKGVYIGLIYENEKSEFTTVKIIKQ